MMIYSHQITKIVILGLVVVSLSSAIYLLPKISSNNPHQTCTVSAQEDCIDPTEVPSGTPAKKLECNPTKHTQCKKIGMNMAAVGVPNNQIDATANLNLGHELQIAGGPGDLGTIAANFNHALDIGVKPILRICIGGSCEFSDPQIYINFLDQLSGAVGNREFYAVAGPNEPLTEVWLGGTEGDPITVANTITPYMNTIITAKSGQLAGKNIKFISPVFNATNPSISQLIEQMKQNQANFAGLDFIGLNSYNTNTGSIRGYLDIIRAQNLGKPYIISEIGMYDVQQGTPRNEGLNRLQSEIAALRTDPEIESALLFSSLGINSDARFDFNVFTPQEFEYILKLECLESKIACG